MLDAAVDGIVTIDERGVIEAVNPAVERLFGYRADEMIGRNVSMLMPAPYHDEHDTYLERYRRTGHRKIIGIGREVAGRRSDGTVFPIELAVAEVPLPDRRLFMGTLRDLTPRKRLEEQLLHSQKLEAVGRLAGGVAHDFNNLLASIQGYSELLLERSDDGPVRHAAEEIRRCAERGAALTRQLLAFSRRQEQRLEPVALGLVLLDLQDMLSRLLGERIGLVYQLDDGLWPLHADAGQLQQVVVNLVVNARDALPNGGQISVSARNVTICDELQRRGEVVPAGDWVVLGVADDGVGMAEATIERIFEPFFTTKEPGKGTGLGLATIHGIVHQSGGRVLVESALGRGSVFEAYLPRASAVGTGTAAVAPAPAARSTAPGGETILLIEDDGTLRQLLEELLRSAGYRVLAAKDGDDALRLASSGPPPHLLLTDMVMPGRSGAEIAVELRHLHPELHLVLMSGYSEADAGATAASELGAVFLHKPFRNRALFAALRQLLDRRADAEANSGG
jgi:PAS domain S-box-containing protein